MTLNRNGRPVENTITRRGIGQADDTLPSYITYTGSTPAPDLPANLPIPVASSGYALTPAPVSSSPLLSSILDPGSAADAAYGSYVAPGVSGGAVVTAPSSMPAILLIAGGLLLVLAVSSQ